MRDIQEFVDKKGNYLHQDGDPVWLCFDNLSVEAGAWPDWGTEGIRKPGGCD